MTANPKAVVLLSGGMDSCVTAGIAAQTHSLSLVHASYGQRTAARERRAFDEIANFYGVSDRDRMVARLDYFAQIGGSALTDSSIAVPERAAGAVRGAVRGTAADSAGEIPVTYVPFRNAHFLSVAVSWAEAIGAGSVWIGAVAEDSSGYPDCRPEYYRAFQELLRVGTRPETRIEIMTPVIHLHKSAIIRRGIDIGVPLHLTWSCYQNDDQACGSCDSCLLRLSAYAEAGVDDPIRYRTGVAPY